ncbi:MAG: sodium:alanine symporter family protein [Clostridia bacterium]|nr:sodium:alanine symporter family protein [Clostridia bacterium]
MNIVSALPLLVLFSGLYFTVVLRGFQFFKIRVILREIKKELKRPRALSSLILALAGTLGVGNVTGVAVGIALGGAGSVFWLVLSSIFSAPIKYCEVALCADCGCDGMGALIGKSFARLAKPLSLIYTALCLMLSLVMGASLQSASIGECARASLGIEPLSLAIILAIFVLFIAFGGADKIEGAVKYIIPLTTSLYILMCLCVIIPNISNLPSTIIEIFSSALNFRACGGGMIGFFTSRAVREGFARGMLSNEAGAGTSAMAHSRAGKRDAVSGGVFGMLEVFFDTVVLCPLTALTILITGKSEGGLTALLDAFSGRIPLSSFLLFICIFFFAASTLLCWLFYGESCFSSLFPRLPRAVFVIIFTVFVCVGLTVPTVRLISLCDICLLFMSAITLSVLFKNTKRIKEISLPLLK